MMSMVAADSWDLEPGGVSKAERWGAYEVKVKAQSTSGVIRQAHGKNQ